MMRVGRSSAFTLTFACMLVAATSAFATVTANPSSVSAKPVQTTTTVNVTLGFTPQSIPGTGTLAVGGMPLGVSTIPAAVTYNYSVGVPTSSTSFAFSIAAAAMPGTYPITLQDATLDAGLTTMLLTVTPPSYAMSIAPNPVTLTIGGSSQQATVTATTEAGFSEAFINYALSGFPAFITNDGPKQSNGPGFPVVAFNLAATSGASGGTYTGMLTGVSSGGQTKTTPFTVIVLPPDINATFSDPSMSICNGASPTTNGIQLSSINGYNGTPSLTFTTIPAGLTLTPVSPPASPMPPSQTVAFTVSASGATSGMKTAVLNISDSTAGINKSITLTIVVNSPDFTSNVLPSSLSLTAGGGAQSVNAAISPIGSCSFGNVNVTTSGEPAGLTITPSAGTIFAPGYGAIPFSMSASSSVTPGTYPITFTFSAGSIVRTEVVEVSVSAAADFVLALNPAALTIPAGSSSSTSVTITPINGFSGVVTVSSPSSPSLTFSPSTFMLTNGVAQTVNVAIATGAATGTRPLPFSATSPGISGTRTATFALTVAAGPDFSLAIDPALLTIPAGGSATTTVSVAPTNGFSGPVNVTAPSLPGITFTPSTFTITTPGAPRAVSVSVTPLTATGSRDATFTGTAPSLAFTRAALLVVTVGAQQDFRIAVTPSSLTIRPGSTASVVIGSTPINGFAGTITVNAPSVQGLTFTPSTFTLTPGTSREVSIQAGALTPGSAIPVTFTATAPGGPAPHTAELLLSVVARAPVLTSATPPSLVAGSLSVVVRVFGDFLQTGAQFVSSEASMVVETSSVLTAQLADVRLRVRADAAPGPRELSVLNPDGGESATPLVLLVYPTSSIGAPLDVTTAAIVFPARGTMIAVAEKLYARGLLATTGTGTIIGSWHFDGVPFDRFVVNAGGGMPVEVRSHVPIPNSFTGGHTLTLVIESPRQVVSPEITILSAIDRASRLTLLAPRDGAVIRDPHPLFRWSLVPNCSGYFVEVALPAESEVPDPPASLLRFRVADAEWHPTADDLKAIGSGVHRWRVRPVCAGDTEPEATEWRRFALLPESVKVSMLSMAPDRAGASVVRWKSEVAGLLYRVEFLSKTGTAVFAALTPRTEYAIPSRTFPAGAAVRVSAIAPGGTILGTSTSASVPARRDAFIRRVQNIAVELGSVEPADGATVTTAQPRIAAEWKGAVEKERVSLHFDDVDLTPVATIAPTSITYDPLIALNAGVHTLTLVVAEQRKQWTITIAPPEAVSPVDPKDLRGDWIVTPIGTVTLVRDVNEQARTQFSAQTDIATGSFATKSTGDVSLLHDLDQSRTVQEGRNWLFDLGARQASAQETLRVGFSQPDFLDQAQFLSTGLARGGAQGKAILPFGTASYYQTFTIKPAGVQSGNFGPDQRVRAAAYQIPMKARWDFRVLGIRVDDYPGLNSSGGKGDALGLFARYTRGPSFNAIFEGARGTFEPSADSFEKRLEGNAWRVGLNGLLGTLSYAFNLRKTDAAFVNPANRGFTVGGVPDRIGADLSLTKMMGVTTVTVQLRHLQDGTAPEVLLVPKTRQTGVVASVQRAFGQHVSLSMSGNVTMDNGDPLPDFFMPETDRRSTGATMTLSEFSGKYNFTQTISRQELSDRVNELSNQATSSVTLTAGGTFHPTFSLSGVLNGTRSEGSVIVGETELFMASLQPALNIPAIYVSLQPRASFTRSHNDLLDSESTSEQFQALVTFAPRWLGSIIAFQISADWTRTQFSGNPQPATFTHRYVGTVNLHWRLGSAPTAR